MTGEPGLVIGRPSCREVAYESGQPVETGDRDLEDVTAGKPPCLRSQPGLDLTGTESARGPGHRVGHLSHLGHFPQEPQGDVPLCRGGPPHIPPSGARRAVSSRTMGGGRGTATKRRTGEVCPMSKRPGTVAPPAHWWR